VIEVVDGGVEERVIQEMDRIGLTFQIFIKKKIEQVLLWS